MAYPAWHRWRLKSLLDELEEMADVDYELLNAWFHADDDGSNDRLYAQRRNTLRANRRRGPGATTFSAACDRFGARRDRIKQLRILRGALDPLTASLYQSIVRTALRNAIPDASRLTPDAFRQELDAKIEAHIWPAYFREIKELQP